MSSVKSSSSLTVRSCRMKLKIHVIANILVTSISYCSHVIVICVLRKKTSYHAHSILELLDFAFTSTKYGLHIKKGAYKRTISLLFCLCLKRMKGIDFFRYLFKVKVASV